MHYFVYWLQIVAERSIYERYLPAHMAYLRDLDAADVLVLSGPFTDRTGGMIIIRAETLDDARAVVEADPLVASGVDRYELREWRITGGQTDRIRVG